MGANPASSILWIAVLIYSSYVALEKMADLFGKRKRYVVHEQVNCRVDFVDVFMFSLHQILIIGILLAAKKFNF